MIPVNFSHECYKWASHIAINGDTKEVSLVIEYRDQTTHEVVKSRAEKHSITFDEGNSEHVAMFGSIIQMIEAELTQAESS